MKLRTRVLGIVWLVIGMLLIAAAVHVWMTPGDVPNVHALFLAFIALVVAGLFLFLIPGIIFLVWHTAGWFLLVALNGCFLLGSVSGIIGSGIHHTFSEPLAAVAAFGAVCLALLSADHPSRWPRPEDK